MAYERAWRRGVPAHDESASPVEPRRTDEAASAVALARTEAAGMQQLDVLALQRTLGNAATAALLSRAPAAEPVTPPGRTPLKVQRSFLKKVKRRLGFGKKKPRAEDLLADPTQWEDTKFGPAAGASSSTAKPRAKAKANAKAKAIRESRLEAFDAKSEGEASSVESTKSRGYSAYAPASDDGKDVSESVSESESGSESEEKSFSEDVGPPTRSRYLTAPPQDEKSESSEQEAESESESEEQSFSEDEGEEQSFSEDEAEATGSARDETADDSLYAVDTEADTTLYPEDAKLELEGDEEDTEFSEDEAKSEAEALASRLAPRQELKAAAPYPKTLSKDKHYDKEATEGTPDLEMVFLAPARVRAWHIVNSTLPSAGEAGGEDWLVFIKREGAKIARMRRAGRLLHSNGQLMRMYIGAQLKPSTHWTDADIERFIDDNGMLRTDADHKAVVKYLDADERTQYELHRDKGVFTQGASEDPFSTAAMATNLAGPGYGIYVMDSDGKMYAESHKVGLFHHSSFLAGGDVAAAGELKVDNGKLQAVTNKTGHYKAGVENLLQALDRFQAWGVSLDSFEVSLVTADTRSRDELKFEKANEFYHRAKAGSA